MNKSASSAVICQPSGCEQNHDKKKVRFQKINDCNYCGHSHDRGNCPAYGKICNRCGIKITLLVTLTSGPVA